MDFLKSCWTKIFTFKTENVQFLTSQLWVVLHDVKKSFEGAHLDVKTIEIHLPHYEIPQLSPHYCTDYISLFQMTPIIQVGDYY